MELHEMLMRGMAGGMGDEEDQPRKPRILPEAQVARLNELLPAFTGSCPYAVGELVTPRRDSPLRHAGEPHMVIALRPEAGWDFVSEDGSGSSAFGRRHDMRVLFVDSDSGGTVFPHWVESAFFEPYEEKDA